jgi:hypothetical protein
MLSVVNIWIKTLEENLNKKSAESELVVKTIKSSLQIF